MNSIKISRLNIADMGISELSDRCHSSCTSFCRYWRAASCGPRSPTPPPRAVLGLNRGDITPSPLVEPFPGRIGALQYHEEGLRRYHLRLAFQSAFRMVVISPIRRCENEVSISAQNGSINLRRPKIGAAERCSRSARCSVSCTWGSSRAGCGRRGCAADRGIDTRRRIH